MQSVRPTKVDLPGELKANTSSFIKAFVAEQKTKAAFAKLAAPLREEVARTRAELITILSAQACRISGQVSAKPRSFGAYFQVTEAALASLPEDALGPVVGESGSADFQPIVVLKHTSKVKAMKDEVILQELDAISPEEVQAAIKRLSTPSSRLKHLTGEELLVHAFVKVLNDRITAATISHVLDVGFTCTVPKAIAKQYAESKECGHAVPVLAGAALRAFAAFMFANRCQLQHKARKKERLQRCKSSMDVVTPTLMQFFKSRCLRSMIVTAALDHSTTPSRMFMSVKLRKAKKRRVLTKKWLKTQTKDFLQSNAAALRQFMEQQSGTHESPHTPLDFRQCIKEFLKTESDTFRNQVVEPPATYVGLHIHSNTSSRSTPSVHYDMIRHPAAV